VMAIHINQQGFDNQIRTHGSVDYTSIARRFSHGCHRLVNNRAVRLFDFVLRRQPFRRIGAIPLGLKRNLVVDGKTYAFELKTRGYYYQLVKPIPVEVIEGRVMGQVKAPIVAYMRKAGVDYGGVEQLPPANGAGIRIPTPRVIAPSESGEVSAGASEGEGEGEGELSSPDTAAGLNVPNEPPTAVGP
ncbi:MAG: L,D-transpeptidase, partial [Myxococcales bacterium]